MTPTTRLKRVAMMRAGGTPPVDEPSMWSDEGTPWVAISDMTASEVVLNTERSVSIDGVKHRRLPIARPGTLLFAMYASVGAIAVLGIEATWNQAILGIEAYPGLCDTRFLRYWLEHLRQDLSALVRSNTQDNLNAEQVGNFPFPILPLNRQQAIADYLDTETTRTRQVIIKKQKMIQLLVERRMTVMTDGVSGLLTSKGVESSNLPWLTPRGHDWPEAKLTLIARLGSGHTPSREHPEWWVDGTIPWITTGEVRQMRSDRIEFIHDTREKLSAIGVANSAAEIHPAGTVVLCRTASAGYSAIMGSDMATSQDFATWTCGPRLRPRFLLLCLRVMRQDLLGRLATGSTHKTIYMPDIEGLRIPLPSLEEQDAVVDAVWPNLHRTDRIIDLYEQQVALLQERRQALITAAVTGELDIPGVTA